MIRPINGSRSGAPGRVGAPLRRSAATDPGTAGSAVVEFSRFALARQAPPVSAAAAVGDRRDDVDEPPDEARGARRPEPPVGSLARQVVGMPHVAVAAQANTTSDRVIDLLWH